MTTYNLIINHTQLSSKKCQRLTRYHCVHVQKIFIISISILHYYTVMQE